LHLGTADASVRGKVLEGYKIELGTVGVDHVPEFALKGHEAELGPYFALLRFPSFVGSPVAPSAMRYQCAVSGQHGKPRGQSQIEAQDHRFT